MGYSYGRAASGRMALACDSCGTVEGARKRPCRFKCGPSPQALLPYCPAPALCGPCYAKEGGAKKVHGDSCRDGAAQAQAGYDQDNAARARGEHLHATSWGDWHPTVPDGSVGMRFVGATGPDLFLLAAHAVYEAVRAGDGRKSLTLEGAMAAGHAFQPWGGPGFIVCGKPAVARLNRVRFLGGGVKAPTCVDCLRAMDPTTLLLPSDPASLAAVLALGSTNAKPGYPEA